MTEDYTKDVELDRTQDVITSEEFDSLENKENKPSFVKNLFSKSKQDSSDSDKNKTKTSSLSLESLTFEFEKTSKKLDDLMVLVEMQGGKLEMEKELRSALNERIIDLSSQLGELRSTLISKERLFDKFEVDFASFQDVVTTINPKTIQENFDKKEIELTKLDSRIERNSSLLKSLQEQISQFNSQMAKIGSFEDLFDVLKKLDTKVKKIIESEAKSEQILSKVESLFVELNSKTKLIDQLNDSCKNLDSSLTEQKKEISVLQNSILGLVKKDDIKDIKTDIELIKKDVFDKEVLTTSFKNLKLDSQKHKILLNKHNSHIISHVSKLDQLTLAQKKLETEINQLKSSGIKYNNNNSKKIQNSPSDLLTVSKDMKQDLKEAKNILEQIKNERKLFAKEKINSNNKIIPSPSLTATNSVSVVPAHMQSLVNFLSEASKKNRLNLNLEKQILNKGWSQEHITLAKKYVDK